MILLVHANDANDAMGIMGEHASAPQQGTKKNTLLGWAPWISLIG
jgi:hypothetical protein